MKTHAAILTKTGSPLELVQLDVPKLKDGQVIVKIKYSGVCGTQMMEIDGKKGEDKWLPHCLGHEAIGEVVECGPSVTKIKKSDSVVLSWLKGEGIDAGGTNYQWNGKTVNAGPVTTFQKFAVISENRATKMLNADLEPVYVLLGCAAPTGMGAVRNVLAPNAGESMIIFGAGGVGLCALMMAQHMKVYPIIVVDISDDRLDWAKQFGADIVINLKRQDLLSELAARSIKMVDHVVEVTGSVQIMNKMLDFLKPQGGKSVLVGNAPFGQTLSISPSEFNMGKSIYGTWGGNSDPDRDFEAFSKIMQKNLPILSKITEIHFPLEAVNEALDGMRSKRVARPVLDMN